MIIIYTHDVKLVKIIKIVLLINYIVIYYFNNILVSLNMLICVYVTHLSKNNNIQF